MKRSREVTILVDALLKEKLINQGETDSARAVIKEAMKEIRRERYEERNKK